MSKVLRIGIIQGGKIIEERRLPERVAVSLGSGERATFSVSSSGLPAKAELFALREGGYVITALPGMSGRVQRGDAMIDVAPDRELALDDTARGKLVIGDLTILFQMVDPPPRASVPVLPKELRQVIEIDRQFTALMVASLVVCTSVAAYARTVPWAEPTIEDLDKEGWLPIPHFPREPEPPAESKTDAPGPKPEPAKPTAGPSGPAGPRHPPAPAGPPSKPDVSKTGILEVIGTAGRHGGHGALVKLFEGDGLDDKSVSEALSGVRGVALADDANRYQGRGAIGGGGSETIASIGTDNSGARNLGPGDKRESKVEGHGTIDTQPPAIDGVGLSREVIQSEMRSKVRALKACYDDALKRTPALAGKLILAFVVEPNGRISGVSFSDDSLHSAVVAECIKERARLWRFPVPEASQSVAIEFPLIFAPGS
jgi:hypothetical protein